MEEKDKKNVKTFKDKLKDRVSLVKQRSTELLLNTKTMGHSRYENRDVQTFVDSLLPETHQEIEIEQALTEYVPEATTKETSQQIRQRRKEEDEFFILETTESADTKTRKSKGKKKSVGKNSKTNSPSEEGTEKNKSPTKIASEYFDLELNKPDLLTSLTVTKIDYTEEAKSLFWDGTFRSRIEENTRQRNFLNDGLAVGKKPVSVSAHLKAILSHSEESSDWFDANDNLITQDYPIRDFDDTDLRFIPTNLTEILTRHVDPEFVVHNDKTVILKQGESEVQKRILEIDLGVLKFTHHPLFSLEHVLANKLIQQYNLYVCQKSEKTLKKLNTDLELLRKNLDCEKQMVLRANGNSYKKIYKNEQIQKLVKDLTVIRKSRTEAASKGRELERNILKLWRSIKCVRKEMKFVCSDVALEIKKLKTNLEKERELWEKMFEQEVSNVLDQIKCQYFIKKHQYNKERNESESLSKLKKPILDCDEDKIRRKTFSQMCETFRQPGDPIMSFKLKHNLGLVTETPEHANEINRRNDIERTKIFVKLSVNNKEVCKTKAIQMNQDFTVNLKISFSVYIPESVENFDITVFEQSSLLMPTLIGELTVKIPQMSSKLSETKVERYNFEMKEMRNNNNFGVGNCATISEMLNKKLGDFKHLHNLDVESTLVGEGCIQVKVGWTKCDENNENFNLTPISHVCLNKKMLIRTKPTKEMLVKLFDNLLDPNDPKHTFLYTFMSNFQGRNISTTNFYLDDTFNFNFVTTRRDEEGDFVIQKDREINDNSSQLALYDIGSISGRISKTPRQSVLDDMSFANRILDPIDLHRRMSIRYLELVNEHLMMQSNKEKEKQLSDILTFVEYHRIRNIKMDFLRPRQPLFQPSNSGNRASMSLKASSDMGKECSLKVCILKAFQLPCRSEGNNAEEDGGLKMISLRPFVRVSCQGTNLRTSTAVGNNPTWNQQLFFSVKNEENVDINVHLFDEVLEDLLEDDRLENSTVHCQYSANWLASLKVPLMNVVSQPKLEGIFLMYSPPEILGYKQTTEEHYTITLEGLKKEINVKQKGGFYISLLLEAYPNYANDPQIPKDLLESNEMEYMIKYLNIFTDTYKNQHPNRKTNLLVLDTSGKYVCVTRFFKALPLPDFAECIRSFAHANIPNVEESEHSSKSSTPNRKKRNQDIEDVTSQSVKSLLSGGDTGRQSKATRETFELRSLNDMNDDSEKGLALKVNACLRFVSLIPLFQQSDMGCYCIALTGYQTLRLVCGSVFDHSTLLMSYLIQMGVECWCVSGHSLLRGYSSFVLVREKHVPNDMDYKNGRASFSRNRSANWKYFIYDAVVGVKYDTKDPFCPLQKVYSMCNNENIWVNVQVAERCSLVRFNLQDTSDWRPVFQKQLVACPGPLPGGPPDEGLYSHSTQDVIRLRDAIEDKIKAKIQRWRIHRRTIWNRHCSSILRKTLINWEKWCLNPTAPRQKISQKLQQLMMSYQVYGYPYNVTYTTIRDIIACVKATQIHLDEHTHTEYALAVEVFPYPNRVYSVWIYICTLLRRADT